MTGSSPGRAGPLRRQVVRGFTLIEVLVSLLILSVLAASAWKGLDAISTARQVSDENLQQTLRLQAVMTQFETDLAQVLDTQVVQGFQFDGAALRMTRRSPAGVQVVVWSLREGRWQRWASAESTGVGGLQRAWQQSQQLLGRERGTLVALRGVAQWQVFCFRNGAMSNCQSSGDVSPDGGREQLPQAVRLQLSLGEGSGFQGTLSRDLMLAPQPNQD
ncbi:MAG: prepilin-type N-terminal cleavage/methylation domain-containing protein [Aquabacterium sp.]|nr:MAG: prepilin-type N-terminal cleavage/methylation domain-containing protein [Aquabacterium sp.]